MFRVLVRGTTLLVILVLLTVVGSSQASGPSITIAIPTDPDSFDPTESVAAATWEVAFNIYEGLVKSLPTGEITAGLASQWEINEEGTRYTFTLREAYFHNGTRVTPEDVVHALNRMRDPKISQVRAGEYSVIDQVWSEGNRVIITLQEPHSPFLFSLADMAAVIYPKDAERLSARPVGTGPYRFVEWQPNQHIRLERFAEHWQHPQPFFQEAVFRIMPDDNSAVLALKTGHIDLIPRLEPALLHQVESDARLAVHESPMNLVQLLAINNARYPFDDWRVRQAIALAIDKEEIILGAAWGHGVELATGLSPAMDSFYNHSLTGFHLHDPVRARELLAEAGQTDRSVTLDLPAPYALHVTTGEIIAEQLARVGLDVRLQIVEWGTWLERVYSQRDYDLTVIGFVGKLDPHASLVRYQTGSSRNLTNFSDPDFDVLINKALTAPAEERVELYWQAQEILARDVAGVFLMDPSQLVITRREVQGWQAYPIYVIDVAALYR